jgi:hypothetical protein
MSTSKTTGIEKLVARMSKVCRIFEEMVCTDESATVILIRAMQNNSGNTMDELAEKWESEFDTPSNREMIELFFELRRLLGEEWYVICAHVSMREENEDCRGSETQEECPLYGDDIEEVRDMWADRFAHFDSRREKEQEIAKAWLKRQQKKAA